MDGSAPGISANYNSRPIKLSAITLAGRARAASVPSGGDCSPPMSDFTLGPQMAPFPPWPAEQADDRWPRERCYFFHPSERATLRMAESFWQLLVAQMCPANNRKASSNSLITFSVSQAACWSHACKQAARASCCANMDTCEALD